MLGLKLNKVVVTENIRDINSTSNSIYSPDQLISSNVHFFAQNDAVDPLQTG